VEILGQAGVAFSEVTTRRASLEDVYFQLTGGQAEFHSGPDGQAGR
jgi:ABC-2 type transport system ATP-binding protein